MAESQEQEPKSKSKKKTTTTKPRRTRTTATPRRKKPAADKKTAADAAAEVTMDAPDVAEAGLVAGAVPPVERVTAPSESKEPPVSRKTTSPDEERRQTDRPANEDESDFNAGLWSEDAPRRTSEPVEESPVESRSRWDADADREDTGAPEIFESPSEDREPEPAAAGGRDPEPILDQARDDFSSAGPEAAQNGERRRRRRRGRRGRGRGRDSEGNGQTPGQPGAQQTRPGGGGPAVADRPPRDQRDQRDRREQHDQRGRRDQRDQQQWRDRRGGRDQRDQRDRREPVERRDHRGQQDRQPHRDQRDRDDRRPEPQRPPQPVPDEMAEGAPEVQGTGDRTMLINVAEGEECRIAIMHQGRLEELFMERASAGSHVGNIYKGRVTNVEPSIQAAFIDFGMPKNGFLHISDLQPQYFPDGMRQIEEVGRKTPRRERPPIQKCLRRGQEVLVQIIKEGIGTKGPTLTTYISIPGRFLVMLPGMNRLGVSRKIEDEEGRRKMRRILDELDLPRDMGFILRTAGMDSAKRELQRDLQYLQRLWKVVANRIKNDRAPCELYQESDLVIRTVRDVFSADYGKIIVDDEVVAQKIRDFISIVMPRGSSLVEVHKDPEPLFHKYGIEEEIERINARHVPLPLGGSLVIDSTEALVAIDVNSGRYRDLEDAEETAYRINIEAAEEIARQLRLRDLGGLIVCDFIDMRMDKHRRAVERALRDALKKHKERAKCLRMSQFGIIEMTRQRMRPSIKRSIYQDCPHCRGSGLVKNAESMTLDIMRLLRLTAHKDQVQTVEVRVASSVAHQLLNRKRAAIFELEQAAGRRIIIRADSNLGLDQYLFECLDARGGIVETIEPPVDTKAGADARSKRNAPPAEGREGRESFEDVFD